MKYCVGQIIKTKYEDWPIFEHELYKVGQLVDISDERGFIWFEVIENDADRIHLCGKIVEVVDGK